MPHEKAGADITELRQLIGRFLDGDDEVFEQIFIKWAPFVRRILRPYCIDEDSTDEEVGIVFYPGFHKYILKHGAEMLDNPMGYLRKMARSHGVNVWRKAKRERDRTTEIDEGDVPGSSDSEKDAENKEVGRLLQVEFDKLSPNERHAVVLVDVEGHSYEEAASIMKAPIGSVKAWLYRARNHVRIALGPTLEKK